MNVGNVLRLTAWAWAAFAAAGLLAVAAAAVGGARAGELFGLGLGVGLSGFASGLAFAISRSDRLRPLRVGDVAMGLILAWATTPFFMAVGAVAAGWRDGVWRGYVAAVSAATTTGPLFDLGFATDAALYWDAYCAWLGGAATLSGAAVLTVQLDPSVSKQLPPVFARPDESMRERRLAQILKAVALAYAACTVAAALMFVAAGHQGPELLIRTLSGPAAGGYGAAPENAAEAAAAGFVGLLSALGVWTIWRAAHGDLEPIWRDVEWRALFAATFGAAAIIMALDDGAGLWPAFYEAVAMITGAGGPFDADPIFSAPPAFAIGLAFVGGCTLSSAGGLKWSRIVRFIRELGRELDLLIDPRTAEPTNRARKPGRSPLTGQLALAAGIITIATIVYAPGRDGAFEAAAMAVATFSNSGPVFLGVVGVDGVQGDFWTALHACVIMIAGRLETVILVPILGLAVLRLR